MQHLDEGTIHAWLDDALSPEESARVAAHAASCAECGALVAEARGLVAGSSRIIAALDDVPANVIPRPSATATSGSLWRVLRLTPARAAIAATLLVGVASMFTARRQTVATPDLGAGGAVPATAPIVAAKPAAPHADSAGAGVGAVESAKAIRGGAKEAAVRPKSAPSPAAKQAQQAATEAAVPPVASPVASAVTSPITAAIAPPVASAAPPPARSLGGNGISLDAVVVTGVTTPRAAAAADRRQFRESAAPVGGSSVEGCYRLVGPGVQSLAGFPERFSLQRDSVGRNAVVGLTGENRPDSVLSGFAWHLTMPNVATVVGPAVAPTPARTAAQGVSQSVARSPAEPTSLQLIFAATATTARAQLGTRVVDLPIERTTCRP